MSERMILVREQGETSYEVMYLPENVLSPDGTEQPLSLSQLHEAIHSTLGRNDPILKITLDEISIKSTPGIRYMFKKTDPKIEVTFEGNNQVPHNNKAHGYSNLHVPTVPIVAIPQFQLNMGRDENWLTVLERNPYSFGHTGTAINEHLFVFGGFADNITTNQMLLLSDTRTGKFSKLRTHGELPSPRERHSASLIGQKIFVFGGYERSAEAYFNGIHIFETETLNWIKAEPRGSLPQRRCGHSASVVDGKIWIFGGRIKSKKVFFDSESSGVSYCNDLHCYDPIANEWYHYEPRNVGPSGRALHTATVVGRKIYIFGGANSTGQREDTTGFCDLYMLDIDTMSWTECETQNTPPSPCYGHSATYIGDNKIFFFGGKGYQIHNDIHILDLKTMSWKQYAFAGNPLSPRWGHSATLHDTRVLFYGGRTTNGYYNSIETIDLVTELIELNPEDQAKEKIKRKHEEENRTRETIGNLQNSVAELHTMATQLGEQLMNQKKIIMETKTAMNVLRQDNNSLVRLLENLTVETGPPVPVLISPGPIYNNNNNNTLVRLMENMTGETGYPVPIPIPPGPVYMDLPGSSPAGVAATTFSSGLAQTPLSFVEVQNYQTKYTGPKLSEGLQVGDVSPVFVGLGDGEGHTEGSSVLY